MLVLNRFYDNCSNESGFYTIVDSVAFIIEVDDEFISSLENVQDSRENIRGRKFNLGRVIELPETILVYRNHSNELSWLGLYSSDSGYLTKDSVKLYDESLLFFIDNVNLLTLCETQNIEYFDICDLVSDFNKGIENYQWMVEYSLSTPRFKYTD